MRFLVSMPVSLDDDIVADSYMHILLFQFFFLFPNHFSDIYYHISKTNNTGQLPNLC